MCRAQAEAKNKLPLVSVSCQNVWFPPLACPLTKDSRGVGACPEQPGALNPKSCLLRYKDVIESRLCTCWRRGWGGRCSSCVSGCWDNGPPPPPCCGTIPTSCCGASGSTNNLRSKVLCVFWALMPVQVAATGPPPLTKRGVFLPTRPLTGRDYNNNGPG